MIDTEKLNEVFINCMADPHSRDLDDLVPLEGIVTMVTMSRKALEIHRPIITDWLNEMHPNFHKYTEESGGGGWSFLNFCEDKDGQLWTGLHQTCEMLILLGMGLGLVKWCLPRNLWDVLPGGMPYLVIDTAA